VTSLPVRFHFAIVLFPVFQTRWNSGVGPHPVLVTREPRALQSKCLEQLRHMFGRLHFLHDRFYSPVGADEVGGPLGPHVFFPEHAFLDPNLIGLQDFVIRVAPYGGWTLAV
jgi:hypothetical protein